MVKELNREMIEWFKEAKKILLFDYEYNSIFDPLTSLAGWFWIISWILSFIGIIGIEFGWWNI